MVYWKISNNICLRCGKQRVISRTYTESVNGSLLTYTETVCPDPECQKILNMQFAAEKVKREQFAANKASADAERLFRRKNNQDFSEE